MKTTRRIGLVVTVGLLALAALFLFGPLLFHRALLSATPATELQRHQSEWARIVQLEPDALNGSNRETFSRYSAAAFRWFRVRGLIDSTCEDTSFVREWRELIVYFTDGPDVAPPPELASTQ